MRHIPGLDAIRFVCAAIVALGHYYVDWAAQLAFLGAMPARLIGGLLGVIFNGPAAVIVFFVLSGLVIHLPYINGKRFDLLEYYSRRYLRILPPVAAFLAIYLAMSDAPSSWNNTVLWSIICEAIYYLIYPVIRRIDFTQCSVIFGGITLMIAVSNSSTLLAAHNGYVAFGYGTWLIGLPCWLAGCAIATHLCEVRKVGEREIWLWRVGILAGSIILRAAKFHAPTYLASDVVTLTLFCIPVALWIEREARYFLNREAPWLDKLGVASYSLYLVHPLAAMAVGLAGAHFLLAYIAIAALGTVLFYFVVERTSHRAARHVGRRLTKHANPVTNRVSV
jgi:peptidoglycan/LPS O-acetylase OafA/YrhL